MRHVDQQQAFSERRYAHGPRDHVTSDDPTVQYLVRWRLREASARLRRAAGPRIRKDSAVLVLCSGEGYDGSILCDIGFTDVTVSDVSQEGVRQACRRDARLRGIQHTMGDGGIADGSYEIVVVQDGLHHLQEPVAGFTEMLRIASTAAVFLEPHDGLVGRTLGREWERNDEAVNYVFRWDRRLVQDVACSFLGPDTFTNLSFSFWHHNLHLHRLAGKLGGGRRGLAAVRTLKAAGDTIAGRWGNQFCGLVLLRDQNAAGTLSLAE